MAVQRPLCVASDLGSLINAGYSHRIQTLKSNRRDAACNQKKKTWMTARSWKFLGAVIFFFFFRLVCCTFSVLAAICSLVWCCSPAGPPSLWSDSFSSTKELPITHSSSIQSGCQWLHWPSVSKHFLVGGSFLVGSLLIVHFFKARHQCSGEHGDIRGNLQQQRQSWLGLAGRERGREGGGE